MTLSRPRAAALILFVALAMPGIVGAASLSPLDDLGPGAVGLGLDALPGLSGGPAEQPALAAPTRAAPAPFRFMDDTGLNADPLRGVLPENQWANPKAAQNGLIQRR